MKKEDVIHFLILTIVVLFLMSSIFMFGFYDMEGIRIIYGVAVVLLFLQFLKKEKKFTFSKNDFLLILFSFGYFIPIIFQQCVVEEVESVKAFFMFFSIWIISKISFDSWKKYPKYPVCQCLLLVGIISLIVNVGYFSFPEFFEKINVSVRYGDFFQNSVGRLYSTFGYPNAYALFMSLLLFLSLYLFLNNKKYNMLYYVSAFIFLFGITLTISKTIIIFVGFFLMILFFYYYFYDRKKGYLLIRILLSMILPVLVLNNYFRIYYMDGNIVIFIFIFLICLFISMGIYACFTKIRYMIIFLIFFVFVWMFPQEKDLLIKFTHDSKGVVLVDFVNLEKKHSYEVSFSIDDVNKNNDTFIYLIHMHLRNGKEILNPVANKKVEIGDNKFNFEFETTDYFEYYYLLLLDVNKNVQYKISEVSITDLETGKTKIQPVDYYFLPYTYLFQLEMLKYDQGSMLGRKQIYQDCMYIMQGHLLSGQGSSAFNYYSLKNNYSHNAYDEHSFFLKILLEIGLIPLLIFILYIIRQIMFIRKIWKDEIGFYLSISFLLIVFSFTIDFTMSYMLICFIFIFIGSAIEDYKKCCKCNNVMFVASAGGHLTELLMIKDIYSNYNSILITERNRISEKLDLNIPIRYTFYCSRFYMIRYLFLETVNIILSFYYVVRYNPDLIYSTGAHTSVWISYFGYLFDSKIIFVEVYDRICTPTLSGKLVYPIASKFYVQHEELKEKYPNAIVVKGVYE